MALKMKFTTIQTVTMNLYKYFCQEEKRGRLFYCKCNPAQSKMHALGINKRSFERWIALIDSSYVEKKPVGRKKSFDDFDKDVIRREIIKMLEQNERVTLRKLKVWLKLKCAINFSKQTLWKIVRLVGFTFRKTNSGRNIVCEKPHLVSLRSKYLRELRCRREEGYDIVYLDESWINAHHTFEKEWQSVDGTVKRNIPSSKGQRLILAHAGSNKKDL